MSAESFSQLLTLYSWFPLTALLFFLMVIAHFDKLFAGFVANDTANDFTVILFGIHAVYQTNRASADTFIMGLLPATGGLTLIGLCVQLYRKMVVHT